ncbi:hypothetical protein QA596_11745 [Balneolales bacterium ANBcel1]|nr:hypothetical protein [Balneolales bacterium ANBcel1]
MSNNESSHFTCSGFSSAPFLSACLLIIFCLGGMSTPAVAAAPSAASKLLQVDDKLEHAFELKDAFRDEEALEAFVLVLEEDETHFEALWNVVMLHTSIGYRQSRSRDMEAHYESAFEYARRLIDAHPDRAGAHFAYAAAVGRKAQSVGARERLRLSTEIREHAEKAVELDPEYSRAWNVLGNWHHRAANLSRLERLAANALFGGAPEGASNDTAREAFRKALEIDSHFILYYHDKAEFLLTIGEEAEAERVLRQGLEQEIVTSDDELWKENMRELLADL